MDNTLQAITYTVARTRNPSQWINYDYVFTAMDKPSEQSGRQIQVPLNISGLPVEAFIGAESANVSRAEYETAAYYNWVTARANMLYTLDDEMQNDGGPNSIIPYVTKLMDVNDKSLTDKLVQWFCGAGTDSTRRQFNSFQHCANDAADGLGTGTTLGTLDKNVVVDQDGVKVYQGIVFDVGGAGGPTRSNIIRMMGRCTNGPQKPNLIVFHTEVVAEIVAQAAGTSNALVRYQNTNELKIGFEVYTIEGHRIYGQRHMPFSRTVAATNRGYFIDTTSTKVVVHKKVKGVLRPWRMLPLQEAHYASRVWGGNVVCDEPRCNGVMKNFVYNAAADA